MENFIIIAIILAIVGLAVWYIIRSKKRGAKCIGCPEGCCSAKKGDGSCCCCDGQPQASQQSNSPKS